MLRNGSVETRRLLYDHTLSKLILLLFSQSSADVCDMKKTCEILSFSVVYFQMLNVHQKTSVGKKTFTTYSTHGNTLKSVGRRARWIQPQSKLSWAKLDLKKVVWDSLFKKAYGKLVILHKPYLKVQTYVLMLLELRPST